MHKPLTRTYYLFGESHLSKFEFKTFCIIDGNIQFKCLIRQRYWIWILEMKKIMRNKIDLNSLKMNNINGMMTYVDPNHWKLNMELCESIPDFGVYVCGSFQFSPIQIAKDFFSVYARIIHSHQTTRLWSTFSAEDSLQNSKNPAKSTSRQVFPSHIHTWFVNTYQQLIEKNRKLIIFE